MEAGEDGRRKVHLSIDLKDGLVRRRRKPPGRRRRDQLRREAWLRRREDWSPPGEDVSDASSRESRLAVLHTSTPGATREEEGTQTTSGLDTDNHGTLGATSFCEREEGESMIEDTSPAPGDEHGEDMDNDLDTDYSIYENDSSYALTDFSHLFSYDKVALQVTGNQNILVVKVCELHKVKICGKSLTKPSHHCESCSKPVFIEIKDTKQFYMYYPISYLAR